MLSDALDNVDRPLVFRWPNRKKASLRKLLPLLAAGVMLAAGCGNPTQPCGTFSFTGSPNGDSGENIQTTFAFNPSVCNSNCTTKTIAYIQIVRVIDQDTGEFLAPSTQQQDRIVTGQSEAVYNGWAVDRIDNRVWGYYARNNDGSFASYLTTGSSTTSAILGDGPYGWCCNTWFDAVDVPVCIDPSSSCVNNLLGYYYWAFVVDSSGGTGAPFSEIGVDWNQTAVDLSIAQWNATAPGVGKNVFPAFTRMH
jgi:hypothetical protein